MTKIKVCCPAKINLSLKILNKRNDGFHNIESVMQAINLFDFLTICCSKAQSNEIVLNGTSDEIPYNEKNLVYNAATLFFESCPNIEPIKTEIFIEKNIPVAAGLAGGSTDAAGTLLGLNEIFERPLNKTQLHNLCAQLGSDLNFCLDGGCQKATGRGEILEKLPFKNFSISLIKPKNIGISAGFAYKKFAEKFVTDMNERKNFVNDLEWAIIDEFEELKKIKNKYPNSIMSGSGSTFYLINDKFEQEENFLIKNDLKAIDSGIEIIFL